MACMMYMYVCVSAKIGCLPDLLVHDMKTEVHSLASGLLGMDKWGGSLALNKSLDQNQVLTASIPGIQEFAFF